MDDGTSMDNASKRRVDSATAREGMSEKRCLIENTGDKSNIIHYAHCLARETKDPILDALEFSWGMPHRTLNLDTRYNVFHLGSKFHALYDKKKPVMCILLPEEHIIRQYYNARNDRNSFPKINEPSYKYNFLAHDDMISVPIHRLTPADNLAAAPPADAYTYFAHPYATLGPLTSHVHPQFVICDTGKKFEKSATSIITVFSELYPNHTRALLLVAAIWKAWTQVPDNTAFEAFREQPYTGDNMSSTSKRTAKKRLFPPAKRRGGGKNETPTRASKRSKLGQGANDGI